MKQMEMLRLKDKHRKVGTFELRNINLEVTEGEYFVLLGRSGAGKSQLLELVAGLTKADSGSVFLDGEDITRSRIQERQVGLVFQDFALFPHLTVEQNIGYPLRMLGENKALIGQKTTAIAEQVNITHLLSRMPDNLSGGEKQRVAIARTLVRSPRIILLDEPMASIDTPLKDDLRRLLKRINNGGMTILHVTHDYREAIRLAHRVGVIHNGKILQTGIPGEVFANPVNRFVARFAGIQNFFRAEIDTTGSGVKAFTKSGVVFTLSPGEYPEKALLMIRSGDVKLSLSKPGDEANSFAGKIEEIGRAESGYEVFIDASEKFHALLGESELMSLNIEKGSDVYVSFAPEAIKVLK